MWGFRQTGRPESTVMEGGSRNSTVGARVASASGSSETIMFGMAIRPGDTEPPFVLGKLVRFLQARPAPDLFQKKPNSAEVAALRSRLTADKTTAAGLQLSSYIKDPHVVAEVLKQYLAALPDPIFTYDYYNSFMNVLAIADLGDRLSMLRMLIYSLPPGYQSTSLCLLELLHTLHMSSIMDAEKLSLIFGPCFLRPEHQQAFMASDNLTCCQLLQLIIEHGELIMRPDSSKMAALPPSPVRHLLLPIQRFNAIAVSRKQGVVLPSDELPPLYQKAKEIAAPSLSNPTSPIQSDAFQTPATIESSSSSSSLSSSSSSSSLSASSSASSSSSSSSSSTEQQQQQQTSPPSDETTVAPLAEAELELASEQPFDDSDLTSLTNGDDATPVDINSFVSVSVIGSPHPSSMSSPLRSSTSPSQSLSLSPDVISGALLPSPDDSSSSSSSAAGPSSSALLRVVSESRHARTSSINTEIFLPPDSPPLPPPPTGSPPAPGLLASSPPLLFQSPTPPPSDPDSLSLSPPLPATSPAPPPLREAIMSAVQLLGVCAEKVKNGQISPTQLSQSIRDLNRQLSSTVVDTLRLDPNVVVNTFEVVGQEELAGIDTASPVGELTKFFFEGLNETASALRFLEANSNDESEKIVADACVKVTAALQAILV